MIFDLHIHTYYSDGLFSPEEIVNIAINKGIDGIAITDHDTIEGVKSILNKGQNNKLHIIPGIEMGTIFQNSEVHILGYFIDYNSKRLINAINWLKTNRIKRGMEIIKKLNSLDIHLSYNKIKEFVKGDYIGRPHIAKALVKEGYVKSIEEAFDKYLNRGKAAYIQRKTLTLKETINLIHEIGGIAVLAHPGILKEKEAIYSCINYGIDGIEVIHSKHTNEDIKTLLRIAKQNDLIITGGSDCHGKIINGDYLIGKYYINIDDIPQMKGRL